MGIKDKQTYGEYFWAMQVEAQAAFDEQIEDTISPIFQGFLGDIPDLDKLPASVQRLLHTLAAPSHAGAGDLAKITAAEFGAEVLKDTLKPGMSKFTRWVNRGALETWLNSEQAIMLFQRNKIDNEYFYFLLASEGYQDIMADRLYSSLVPYPTIPDVMLWARYHGDPDNTKDKVWEKFNVPVDDYELWEWQTLQRITTADCHTLFRRGVIDEPEFRYRLSEIGWRGTLLDQTMQAGWSLPNAMLLTQGNLLRDKDNEAILTDITRGDIHPDYAQKYLDAVLTKPATTDLISYMLRLDPNLPNAEQQLKRIGIHPDYIELYKTLAHSLVSPFCAAYCSNSGGKSSYCPKRAAISGENASRTAIVIISATGGIG